MSQTIKASEFHHALAKRVLGNANPMETDIFCLMLLMHGCQILSSEKVVVSNGVRGFAPITTRHASEVASSLFSEAPLRNPSYWYEKWNGDWSAYAVLEDIPDELMTPLNRVKVMLEADDCVERLVDEDWDLISSISHQ